MTSSPAPVARSALDGRVVVTGGSGFVGRAVVAAFLERGQQVTVVDRDEHPEVPTTSGELTDPEVRDAALDGGDVAGVVHLAAITSVLRSVDDPAETFRANVEVTQALLEGCRVRGIDRLLMASTNAVAGDVGHA
ncbi:MAG: NAD-dependent epimerase/dehydratase family protein, partial [Actinomycetota bacterium]|nr:NAD-dependent epimerase/dehydratase family protein [Actinomycetota bacterium]